MKEYLGPINLYKIIVFSVQHLKNNKSLQHMMIVEQILHEVFHKPHQNNDNKHSNNLNRLNSFHYFLFIINQFQTGKIIMNKYIYV